MNNPSVPQPIVIQHQAPKNKSSRKNALTSAEKRKIKDLENKIKEMTSKVCESDKIKDSILDQLDTKLKTLREFSMLKFLEIMVTAGQPGVWLISCLN